MIEVEIVKTALSVNIHLIFSVSKMKSILFLLIFTILLPNWIVINTVISQSKEMDITV